MHAPKPVRIELAYGVITFSSIYLQKFCVPIPSAGGTPLGIFVIWGVLLWLLAHGRIVLDPLRVALFSVLLCTILISLLAERFIYSVPALAVFMVWHGAMLFRADMDHDVLLRCVSKFQTCMTPIAYIVIGQQLIQLTIGSAYWPNMDAMLPETLMLQGYTYIRPYDWNSAFLTPNGFFFLEPSSVSLFLAEALVVEIVWFGRIKRMILFALGVLACMAGTGVSIVAVLSPVLLLKLDIRLRRLILGLGIPLFLVVGLTGVFSHLTERTTELSQADSSGYGRIVRPFEDTIALYSDPAYLLSGNGPGSIPKTGDTAVNWPSNKLAFEYGTITSVWYHVFVIVAMLYQAPSTIIALVTLVPTLMLGGTFLAAPPAMLMVLLGTLLRTAAVPAVSGSRVAGMRRLSV